jgi:uncharacterized protein YecE (DUF72 family)
VIEVGTQGWNYDAWVGPFYPRKTRADDFLPLYARIFDTVEVDATFYAPPTEAAVRSWLERTPPGFSFAIKLARAITHERRLRECDEELRHFCERARLFGDRLAAVLVQLPPDLSPRERGAFEDFLALLPGDIRFAVEFRDAAWLSDRTLDALERHRVALALVDGEWLPRERVLELAARPTAPFAYARWMGPRTITDHSHVQLDRRDELAAWAGALARLEPKMERVLAYFSNFFQGHAPASANELKRLVGQRPADPDTLVSQPSLF